MSGTYNNWLASTLKELNLRMQGGAIQPMTAVQPNRPRLPPAPTGTGRNKMLGTGFLRSMALGGKAERRSTTPETNGMITEMRQQGLAAEMTVSSAGGRQLKGNFYSAAGHSLVANGCQPDLTRPAVLLLTGSHGSAQDQGLDLGKYYAQNGASVMSVNYGGFGDSDDIIPTEESIYQDAHAMLQRLIDMGYDPGNIVIHGFSMGGAVAGKLKEAMETPRADNSQVEFRGAVLDRPMLSMAHGVLGKLPTPLRKMGAARVAASYSRQALGKFGARGAITRGGNVQTPMVITSDEGYFADKAEELRTSLQAARPGRVSGAQSNQDHMLHKPITDGNDLQLKALLQQDRTGTPQANVTSAHESSVQVMSQLTATITRTLNEVTMRANQLHNNLNIYAAGTGITAQYCRNKMVTAEEDLGKALDLSRNMPAIMGIWKADADALVVKLRGDLLRMTEVIDNDARTAGGAPPAVSAELADTVSHQAQAALDAIPAPPTAASFAQQRAVLDADVLARKMAGLGGAIPAQLLTDLQQEVTAIRQQWRTQREAAERAQRRLSGAAPPGGLRRVHSLGRLQLT